MKVAVLFSGGKDSTYALYRTMKEGHEIKYLITLFPKKSDSWMFHYPCIELTKLQAESLGIKQIFKEIEGEKEKELGDLEKILKRIKNEINGIVSGALASNYQKQRIDKICRELGLKSLSPLWHKDQEEILKEECSIFDVIITGVAAEGFDESWLGRTIDKKTIDELKKLKDKFGINIVAEGGEYESFVIDGPIFNKRIEIINSKKIWDNRTNSGYLEIEEAKLVPK